MRECNREWFDTLLEVERRQESHMFHSDVVELESFDPSCNLTRASRYRCLSQREMVDHSLVAWKYCIMKLLRSLRG